MIAYLSEAWIQAADDAVRSMEPLPTSLVVGYTVEHDDEQRTYTVRFGPEQVSVRSGLNDPTIVISTDRDTAFAIASGQLSAQRAFLAGDLNITGDPNSLLGHGRALTELNDRLATLRARTEL